MVLGGNIGTTERQHREAPRDFRPLAAVSAWVSEH